jgi:CHAT domain-containing protein
MSRTRWSPATLIALVLPLVLSTSCTESPLHSIQDSLPDLVPEFARHLESDDDAEFLAYVSRTGYLGIKDARHALVSTYIGATSPEDLQRRKQIVKPYLERIDRALEVEFASPEYRAETACRAGMTPEQDFRLQQLADQAVVEAAIGDSSIHQQFGRLAKRRAEFEALGYRRGVMFIELHMADVVMRMGRGEERQQLLASAVAHARALNERNMLCQALGGLGPFHAEEELSQHDRHLEEIYEVATRHRIPDQRARALSFMASNAAGRGQYARALDLYFEAIQVCRESGGGGTELRYVVRAMGFLAGLGCWDVVDRLSSRLAPLERAMTPAERHGYAVPRMDGAILSARSTMRLGKVDEGNQIFLAHEPTAANNSSRIFYARFLDIWSAALLDAGRANEALPIAERGIRYCDQLRVDETVASLLVHRAKALSKLGQREEAIAALNELEGRMNRGLEVDDPITISAYSLKAKLQFEHGDRANAERLVRRALDRVVRYAQRLDGGPTSELALATLEEVRNVAHQVLAADPITGYGLEMDWRSLVSCLGDDESDASPRWRMRYSLCRQVTIPPGQMHVAYHVGRDAITRWTVTADGVRRHRIPVARDSCAAMVRRAAELVRWRKSEVAESEGHGLTVLANLLLPPELSDPSSRIERLWISPDGPLTALPFEALLVGSGVGGRTLANTCEVAYLHSLDPARSPAPGRMPVIVSDPAIPDAIRRRHQDLTALPAVGQEVAEARRVWPNALVIQGRTATRDTVVAAWRRASQIYLAAHLVQDPEVPLATFIPLAVPPATPAGVAYLDPRHIRSTDLSGCELVVLSSCSGGAPYVGSSGASLGMAGAFLDAGAAAVVRTTWPIRDEDAQRFAGAFLEEWSERRSDPVGAINRARGRLLREAPDGPWFAWSIAVRGLPAKPVSGPLAAR